MCFFDCGRILPRQSRSGRMGVYSAVREQERVLQGGVARTTNNRVEMTAAIEGLRALTRACDVEVVTDSEYLRRGMTEFLARCRSNGWKSASGNPVLNQDLWQELDDLAGHHR